MKKLINRINKLLLSTTAKDTYILFIGNSVSSILAILFTLIAARQLGPENWGIVAAVGSFMTIIIAFGDLGFGSTVLRFVSRDLKYSIKDAIKVYRTIYTIRLYFAIVVSLILISFSKSLSSFIFKSDNPWLIIFSTFGFFGFLLLDIQVISFQARRKWKVVSFFIALTNSLRLVFLIILYFLGKINLFTTLLIFSGCSFIGWFVSMKYQKVRIGLADNWKKPFLKIIPFSFWMALNKIVSTVSSRLDVILLLQLAGNYYAGIYSAANRFSLGVLIIITSFAEVLAPRFSQAHDKNKLVGIFKTAFEISLLLSFTLILGIFIAPLVMSLFGPEYHESKRVLQLLFAALIPFTLATPAVNLLIYGLNRPKIVTWLSVIQLPIMIVFNLIMIPRLKVYSPVITMGFINTTTALVTYFYAIRFLLRKK